MSRSSSASVMSASTCGSGKYKLLWKCPLHLSSLACSSAISVHLLLSKDPDSVFECPVATCWSAWRHSLKKPSRLLLEVFRYTVLCLVLWRSWSVSFSRMELYHCLSASVNRNPRVSSSAVCLSFPARCLGFTILGELSCSDVFSFCLPARCLGFTIWVSYRAVMYSPSAFQLDVWGSPFWVSYRAVMYSPSAFPARCLGFTILGELSCSDVFFFFCVPNSVSGVHHFGWDFCVCDLFFLFIQPLR